MIKHNHQLDKKKTPIFICSFSLIKEGRKTLNSHNLGAVSQEKGCPVGVWDSIFLKLYILKLFFYDFYHCFILRVGFICRLCKMTRFAY